MIAAPMQRHFVFVSCLSPLNKRGDITKQEKINLLYMGSLCLHSSVNSFTCKAALPGVLIIFNFFVAQTCSDAGKHSGCCVWSSTQSCFVPGGRCYCDSYCTYYNDCCSDVPSSVNYQYCGKQNYYYQKFNGSHPLAAATNYFWWMVRRSH